MIMKMYTVYDSKIGAYAQPFFMRNAGEAIRGFMEVIATPNHAFNKYPADYTLFEIGEFCDETGAVTQEKAGYTNLGTALSHSAKHFTPGTLEHAASHAVGLKEAQ